jgi:hypothetical protein
MPIEVKQFTKDCPAFRGKKGNNGIKCDANTALSIQ